MMECHARQRHARIRMASAAKKPPRSVGPDGGANHVDIFLIPLKGADISIESSEGTSLPNVGGRSVW